jgi:Ca-activated chloride channel family protein
VNKGTPALCLLLLSTTVWGQAASAVPVQEPDQPAPTVTTLKVVTGLVAISAVVKSKDGEAASGLSKDDFILKQDGKEEPITFFSRGSALPLSLALMVDTSASQRTFVGDESLASDVFFETMLGNTGDRATLVQFDTAVMQLKSMTNSANALHLALSHLNSRASASGGTLLYDAVYAVAKSVLANEKGRKAMVILSDGGDNGSRRSLAEAIEQAQRGDVQIYAILYTMWDGGSGVGSHTAIDPGLEALRKLSESTGGRVFAVSRTLSLREIYAQIGEDLRLQYELGYKPPSDTKPDSYHKLELKAKDKKLTVQARKGFFEPP